MLPPSPSSLRTDDSPQSMVLPSQLLLAPSLVLLLFIHQVNVNSLLGSKFKVVNEKGHAYIMYTLSPITLSATNAGFTSSAQWSGVIRIAALNSTNPDAETALDTSSAVYPTSMWCSWIPFYLTLEKVLASPTPSVAKQLSSTSPGQQSAMPPSCWWWPGSTNGTRFTWIKCCTNIFCSEILQNPTYVPSIQFLTVKGYQNGVLGSTWIQKFDLTTVTWFAPRALDLSCTDLINRALDNDVAGLSVLTPGVCPRILFLGVNNTVGFLLFWRIPHHHGSFGVDCGRAGALGRHSPHRRVDEAQLWSLGTFYYNYECSVADYYLVQRYFGKSCWIWHSVGRNYFH